MTSYNALCNAVSTQQGRDELKQFLYAYHQTLNTKYALPVIKTSKALHSACEVLGFKNWHELSARCSGDQQEISESDSIWVSSFWEIPSDVFVSDDDDDNGVVTGIYRQKKNAYYAIFRFVIQRIASADFIEPPLSEVMGDEFDPEEDPLFDDHFKEVFEQDGVIPLEMASAVRQFLSDSSNPWTNEARLRAFFDSLYGLQVSDIDEFFDVYFEDCRSDFNTGWSIEQRYLDD